MTTIIKVPAVFSCKLPNQKWLNLARVRTLEYEENERPLVRVTWDNGDRQFYAGEEATALLAAWEEAHKLTQERLPA
jgi:hypothetical protein